MNLARINITFNTHNENKNASTILHVFIKNRRPDTSTGMGQTDYISNHLAYEFNQRPEFAGINEFLGRMENIAPETPFDDPSSHSFDFAPRSNSISNEEIFLPVVYIHILADDSDRWIFSYTVTLVFDDGHSEFSFSSDVNGVTGIILDQGNRDYCGIGTENPFNRMPTVYKPTSDLVLSNVKMLFSTRRESKNGDTTLNVHIVNRLSATSSHDILVATDLRPGQEFAAPSVHELLFAQSQLSPILMQDIVLPQIFINIGASKDLWIFDYQIFFYFTSPTDPNRTWTGSSGSSGITLDQDNHKFADVYNGNSFPTVDPLGKPSPSLVPSNYPVPTSYTVAAPKKISISYLQKKLDDLINNRQADPLYKIRLHNTGRLNGDTLPESYYNLQSISADPPAPGTLCPPGFNEAINWTPGPSSLGQLYHTSFGDLYFDNLNSSALKISLDPTSPTPLVLELDFDCSGSNQIVGGSSVSFTGRTLTSFIIKLHLTLVWDRKRNCVDLMSWASEIPQLRASPGPLGPLSPQTITGQYLGKPLTATAPSLSDYQTTLKGQVIDVRLTGGGVVEDGIRDSIFSTLTTKSPFDGLTPLDHLNSTANSWLLGGVLASDPDTRNATPTFHPNGVALTAEVSIESDAEGPYIALAFDGPKKLFIPPPYSMPAPDPGPLANIDHIVVLTMENRSFDHMLGYLSLPVTQQGMGRSDIDGLKGHEINFANGVGYPSKPFAPFDTIMNPDPPHSGEPVFRSINNGAMDGFAQAYFDNSGKEVAGRIMQYHTAANVPTYDALARDFAICNRWFAAYPGPTFCNRFHELTGFLNIDAEGFWEGHNSSPKRAIFTATIFDYLSQNDVSWKYFENYYCFLRFFQSHTFDDKNIVEYGHPGLGFVNVALTGNLPSVTFIDPHFIELPPDGNCDGAPADVAKGQQLVNEVVNAVVSGPNWDKTMLIIIYDEHGGIFDHVPPPEAAVIMAGTGLPTTYGVRVPAFIVSPLVAGGSAFGHSAPSDPAPLVFDHTSILKTIATRFLSHDMPPMGARFEAANDLSSVVLSKPQMKFFRPYIPYGFVFAPSNLSLELDGAISASGLSFWQNKAADVDAQKFALEDAGGGHFYIRTFPDRLYLTVDAPTANPALPLAVRQVAKYPAVSAGLNPDAQKWSISPALASMIGSPMYQVASLASPGKVLQPLGASKTAQISVVVDAAPANHLSPMGGQCMWIITNPFVDRGQRFAPPVSTGATLTASASSLNFSSVDITDRSPQQTVTLVPPPGAQLIISSIALLSDVGAAGDFLMVPPPGSPPPFGTIQVQDGQLVLTVWFKPTAAGARTAHIEITNNLSSTPLKIALAGTGVAVALPVLQTSVGTMFFSPKKQAPPPLKLTNTGNAPLVISSIKVQGTNFNAGTACVGTLAPGQSCTIPISCHFIGPGGSEDLVITHNAHGSPTVIDLSATDKLGNTP